MPRFNFGHLGSFRELFELEELAKLARDGFDEKD